MKNWILLFLLSTASTFAASSQKHTDTWLCVSEESTGFYFEKGKWGRAKFDASEEKFIIRPIKESDGRYFKDKEHPYGVFPLGRNIPSKQCSNYENIVCKDGLGELLFSPETGRFIKTYTAGYWDGQDNNDDTPNITRGRCSKI